MNEALYLAEDYVGKVEDRIIIDDYQNLKKMKRRAEASNTNIAWQEFYSAIDAFVQELDRQEIDADQYNFSEL